MLQLLKVASPFCVYDECPGMNGASGVNRVSSHYNIGQCLNIPRGEHIFISVPVFIQGRACYGIKCTLREGERVTVQASQCYYQTCSVAMRRVARKRLTPTPIPR